MKELIERFKAELPEFWKKFREFGLYLTGVSATILFSPPIGVQIPEIIVKIAGYSATAGFVITALSQFTKKDTPTPKDTPKV